MRTATTEIFVFFVIIEICNVLTQTCLTGHGLPTDTHKTLFYYIPVITKNYLQSLAFRYNLFSVLLNLFLFSLLLGLFIYFYKMGHYLPLSLHFRLFNTVDSVKVI